MISSLIPFDISDIWGAVTSGFAKSQFANPGVKRLVILRCEDKAIVASGHSRLPGRHADRSPMNTTALLSNLEVTITSKFPVIAKQFNSGISATEFERLESTLSPYRLPEDCRKLYEWHDGATEPLELIPDTAIGSRETQIRRQYEIEVEPVEEQPLFDGMCEVVIRHMCKAVIRHLILRE